MSQSLGPAKFVLLLWDAYYYHHLEFNKLLVSALAENANITILTFPPYYEVKQQILANLIYDRPTEKVRFSRRKALRQRVKHLAKVLLLRWPPKVKPSSFASKNCAIVNCLELVSRTKIRDLRKAVRKLSADEIYNLKYRDVHVGEHLIVDMSLDCKSSKMSYAEESIELRNLRHSCLSACIAIEALEILTTLDAFKSSVFLSTSVYTLDWSCKDFLERKKISHFFVESDNVKPGFCKIYKSASDDILNRKHIQNHLVVRPDVVNAARQFSTAYLTKRFGKSSAHTYSPCSTSLQAIDRLASVIVEFPDSPLWTYFTNSPDELNSILHDHQYSGLSQKMPWAYSGVAQDEYEAISLIAALALEFDAILVIRQHPRLFSEKRSVFVSSEYGQMRNHIESIRNQNPQKIVVVEPFDQINSYELAILSDRVVSFRGTMPLEASLMGFRPIVLAKNKGFCNFHLNIHSSSAPSSIEELRFQLQALSPYYSKEEMSIFATEFFASRSYAAISLIDSRLASTKLCNSISCGTSLPALAKSDERSALGGQISVWSDKEHEEYFEFVRKLSLESFL